MNRRSVLKAIGALFVTRRATTALASSAPAAAPLAPIAPVAQAASQAAPFAAAELNTLTALAEAVLPSALSADDRRLTVRAFSSWFANYKAGADMGHGYGSSTLRAPSGPSPISRYPAQFTALDAAAREKGAQSFAALPVATRRDVVESILNGAQPVNRLPAQPTGASLVADFMGSYFNSQAGWNHCYRAEINRDTCRTLDGSEKPPAVIRG